MTTSGIDFKNFTIPTEDPAESCTICCAPDMRDGLEHRVGNTAIHRFHGGCVTSWLDQQQTCPLCRESVTSINGVDLGITEDTRGSTVLEAAREGDLDTVNTYLAAGTISDQHRGLAVVYAARNGRTNIVNSLLDNSTISDEHRGRAVEMAAKFGHADIVNSLLTGHTIPLKDRLEAINWAIMDGRIDIVRTLVPQNLRNQLAILAVASAAAMINYFYYNSQALEEE